jgi:hypothetical protein
MRWFLPFLMIIFAFNSYSAAAGMLDQMPCCPDQEQSQAAGLEDCHEPHSNPADHADHSNKDKKDAHLNCHHCCAQQALSQSGVSMSVALQDDVLNPLPTQFLSDSFIASFLRPPRTLV